MSLKNCKECGRQISNRAEACPGCGHGTRPKQYGCGHLLAILLTIGIVAILLNKCGKSSSSGSGDRYTTSSHTGLSEEEIAVARAAERKAADEDFARRLEAAGEAGRKAADDGFARRLELKAERLIKARLKNPESFRWAGVGYTENEALGFVIFGSFRAQNSFGGYTVTRFIYGGKTLLLEGEASGFEEAWKLL